MRGARLVLAGALATGGLLSTASGCTSTSTTCLGDDCKVTFEGGPGTAKLSSLGNIEVKLFGYEGKRAHLSVGGAEGEVPLGAPTKLGDYAVTVTRLSEKKVVLQVSE